MAQLDPRRHVVCRGCSAEFPRDPMRPKRVYCTWDCFKRSRHVTLDCVVCGSSFDSYVCEQRKREARGHVACCSRDCRNRYTSRLLGGDGTWRVGGRHAAGLRGYAWRKTRLAYLRLVGGRCEGCEGPRATEVHHLQPVSRGGDEHDFGNLMAVCRDCHDNMHTQIRDGAFWDSFEAANANL